MASLLSHRQTVLPLMEATMPRLRAQLAIWPQVSREKGRPSSSGNWHARALTATTISGGKSGGSAPPWPFLQAGQALVEESLSPLGDDLPRQIQLLADLFVCEARGSEQDNLGSHDITIR